jgi:hypothetical protein
MEKKLFEEMLNSMGIAYTHTASRASSQLRPSQGHYNISGSWIEDDFILNAEPDGVEIKSFPKTPVVCEYCDLLVDKTPVIQVQCKNNKFDKTEWKIKCKGCKKDIEYKDFNAGLKPEDK